jgi:hypothetical protein
VVAVTPQLMVAVAILVAAVNACEAVDAEEIL